jgi:protein-tyrosine phosphatase
MAADEPIQAAERPRVLFVCTGNICRSPYAEFTMRTALLTKGIAVDVDSAGTQARAGDPAAPRIVDALDARGIDMTSFRSKPLDHDLIAAADLILTAEVAHRATVVRLHPPALSRVFTLRQFARLVPEAVRAEPRYARAGIVELTAACARTRGAGGITRAGSDDIEDPWSRSAFAYRRAMKAIDAALAEIVAALGRVTA